MPLAFRRSRPKGVLNVDDVLRNFPERLTIKRCCYRNTRSALVIIDGERHAGSTMGGRLRSRREQGVRK